MTPLLYACKENASFVVIKQLIELGSNVSATDTVSPTSHFLSRSLNKPL